MKCFLKVLIIVLVLLFGIGTFVGSGFYNISATEPHWKITSYFIDIFKDRSVEGHSKNIKAPDFTKRALADDIYGHYHEMCRICHGAPGYEPLEFAKDLYPAPPLMKKADFQKEMSKSEIYWVIKNGLKMTGMPAFGPTHEEQDIWGLTALTLKIPKMDAEEYNRHIGKVEDEKMPHQHQHQHN